MAAGIFTPGPIDHYVKVDGLFPWTYLGTAVLAPDQEGEFYKIPVLNDLGGRSVPFQLVQDGEEWTVSTTLNRFDMAVLTRIRTLQSRGPGEVPLVGAESGRARGTLVIGVNDFQLYLANSYSGTPSAGAGGDALNFGRGFYSATVVKYGESTKGTRVLEASLIIKCYNLFRLDNRGFLTYEQGLVGVGSPN